MDRVTISASDVKGGLTLLKFQKYNYYFTKAQAKTVSHDLAKMIENLKRLKNVATEKQTCVSLNRRVYVEDTSMCRLSRK